MSVPECLQNCCSLLESNKITDRKKGTETLIELLNNSNVIESLNQGISISWRKLLEISQKCLKNDCEKIISNNLKKGTSTSNGPSDKNFELSCNLLDLIVKSALKQGKDQINIAMFISYVCGCCLDKIMKICMNTFFSILKNYILPKLDYLGDLDDEHFTLLLAMFQTEIESNLNTASTSSKSNLLIATHCLMLIIKNGPLTALPSKTLRAQFPFITKLCRSLSRDSPRTLQCDVMTIALDLCIHTVEDKRNLCAKFGENVFHVFLDLSIGSNDNNLKVNFLEFCFLQIIIHNPDGAGQYQTGAYAYSWQNWKTCITKMYNFLMLEISNYFRFSIKNTAIFIPCDNKLTTILDKFVFVFVEICNQMFSDESCSFYSADMSTGSSSTYLSISSEKRRKCEASLKSLIENIKSSRSWVWIKLVGELIKKYPKLIDEANLVELLQILHSLLLDEKDNGTTNYIYECQVILLDILSVNNVNGIEHLEKLVGDSTLRAIGLNKDLKESQQLLQKLIKRKSVNLESVIETYTQGVLSINSHYLDTIHIIFQYINFAQFENKLRIDFLTALLNVQNIKNWNCFLEDNFAVLLISLVLKQCPNFNDKNVETEPLNPYKELKELYAKNNFQLNYLIENKLAQKKNDCNTNRSFNLDNEMWLELQKQITNVVENCMNQSMDKRFCIMVLLDKMLHYLIDYNVIEKQKITECHLFELLENLLTDHELCNGFAQYETHRGKLLKCLINIADVLTYFFSIKNNITDLMKNMISTEFIRGIMNIVNFFQNEPKQNELEEKAQIALVDVIGKFSFISVNTFINANQEKIMLAIVSFDYNFENLMDFNLIVTFLNNIKHANVGFIPEVAIGKILKCLKNMCSTRYHCYTSSLTILAIIKDLYPHIYQLSNRDYKTIIIDLLKPFYIRLDSYGPNVAVAVLECIKVICQIDSDNKYSLWDSQTLVMHMPRLLSSDYQKVRYKTIEVLVDYFVVSTTIGKLSYVHRLEVLFSEICTEIDKLFEIKTESDDVEQQSVRMGYLTTTLYMFVKLMLHCDNWFEESLFAIIRLDCEKNIRLIDDGEIMKRAFSTLSSHFGSKQFLNKYLENIIKKWINFGFDFNQFPFDLFNCADKFDLYEKHYDTCLPLLLSMDKEDLLRVAQKFHMNEKDVLKKYCAKIFVSEVITDAQSTGTNFLRSNKQLLYLSETLESQLREVLQEKTDEILVDLLAVVTDEKLILEKFHENCLFLVKGITFVEFQNSLKYIERLVFGKTSIIKYLLRTDLEKVQKIQIDLECEVYKTQLAEQLKRFHHYTIFTDLIKHILTNSPTLITNFLRNTIYYLINLTKNYCNDQKFSKVVLVYMDEFFKSILPTNAEKFENFFVFIVNSVKNFEVSYTHLSSICIEILNFLIVENTLFFKTSIAKLDKFPNTNDYKSIKRIHVQCKSDSIYNTFEHELRIFLESSDTSIRQDSLIHLKGNLINNRAHLKLMYEELQQTNGFSDECDTSLLHRLVCLLIKLSTSTNQSISFEAIKCLGEIGPANLRTVVLRVAEKRTQENNENVLELFTAHVLSLLIQYLVDVDINVVKVANDALIDVLKTKESIKVIESNKDYGYGVINKEYISFHLEQQIRRKTGNFQTWNFDSIASSLDDNEIWCPVQYTTTHADWLISLVSNILFLFHDNFYFKSLIPLCQINVKFCEQILPLLIHLLLTLHRSNTVSTVLSKQIGQFFSNHWNLTINNSPDENVQIALNKKSVKCMLDVITFVRQQTSLPQEDSEENFLKLNYLAIAKAAAFCSAHFTALLYAELWCQEQLEFITDGTAEHIEDNSTKIDYPQLELIYENIDEQTGVVLLNILQHAYKSIGDLDALSGCGLTYLLQPEHRVEYYKNVGRWKDVMYYYSVLPKDYLNLKREYLIESFKMNQLYQLPLMMDSNGTDEPQYECLWRLGEWHTNEKDPLRFDEPISQKNYDKYKFYSLKSICEKDQYTFSKSSEQLVFCMIDKLKHTSLESSKNLYPILTELQSLVEMEDLMMTIIKSNSFDSLLNQWMEKDIIIRENDFQFIEPVAAQRITLLNEYVKQCPDAQNQFFKIAFNFADYAIQECQIRAAEDAIFHIKKLPNLSRDIKNQLVFKEAQLAWLNNDKMIALQLLRKLCGDTNLTPRLKANILKLQGEYMADSYLEQTTTLNSFFEAERLFQQLTNKDQNDKIAHADIYDKIATFADKEYQQIMDHTKSDLFQRKIQTLKLSREINVTPRTEDGKKAARFHREEKRIDEFEISNIKKEKERMVCLALKYYLKNLIICDLNNIKIFRIMSLFLENKDVECIRQIINQLLPELASYKYIIMLPQLVPHISSNLSSELFNKHINRIVMQCAQEHPHHTLPLLLALVNAHEDGNYVLPANKTAAQSSTTSSSDRIKTAKSMVHQLKKNQQLSGVIKQMQFVSEALIELAYYTSPEKTITYKIPKDFKISKIRNFTNVLIPTCTLPVSKMNTYSNITGIMKFATKYTNVGGINTPKRIECISTCGTTHTQLVKGKDDLRQDAVMQQVFQIMNDLLRSKKTTKHLHIRTYKIVPLSMRSGILEWVPNSMTLGHYLVGNRMIKNDIGAHVKYRPNDFNPLLCFQKLKDCSRSSPDQKLKEYNNICKNFKPVFHKFFETYFPQPSVWYERRRAYIYSVATSSMCGYILGIGDRHVNNILIDKQTAEVVHIDFGIAFEQGKCLPTPETIPFRLTRDVVDGMGVSGVEGLFRTSCEKTMQVLRANTQTIVTILEVLLYDPLYFWAITPAQANKRQTDESNLKDLTYEQEETENKNVSAERALLRLKCKLQGTEGSRPTSIEQQVGRLIQQAMDPANLCRPYFGWQPYL